MKRPMKPRIQSAAWDYSYRYSTGEEYSLTRKDSRGYGLRLSISKEKGSSVWDLVAESIAPGGLITPMETKKVDNKDILDKCSELMELSGFLLTFKRGYTMDDYREQLARWQFSREPWHRPTPVDKEKQDGRNINNESHR